ncbi:polysaccharide transporter, PST family [Chryseobacterium taeanense]|uniref:Polysaccharide transporter, PST family n=1 Tax=Chryseobacterium taeanense TaxID=311334 RepID=A0A1G8ECE7_9FLAO|nr:oligosaccharide flippase family protein [Chryseobacterium taeanense]SDH67527.1 polysaccharide transporter, PST family [Chryseobacterium taeanense]
MFKNKVFENIFSLGVSQIANMAFPFITMPYVSRIIGPEGYGILNYSTAFIGYFVLFILYSFDLSGTKAISRNIKDKEFVNMAFSEVIYSRCILYLISSILFMLSLFFGKALHKDYVVSIILFVGLISSVFSPQFIYQSFQDLKIFSKINLIRGFINMILIFLFVKTKHDYFYIPLFTTVFNIFINIGLFGYAKRKYSLKLIKQPLNNVFGVIFNDRFIFISNVIGAFRTTTNTIILGFFITTKEIGYFTTSINFLFVVVNVFFIPISTAIYPFISNSFSKSVEVGNDVVKKIVPITIYFYFFTSLCLLIFSPLLITFIFGNKFDESIKILQTIAFVPLTMGLCNLLGVQVLLNYNFDKLYFRINLFCNIVGLILNFFLSKKFGYYGAAWNLIFIDVLTIVLCFYFLKILKINIIKWKYFSPIVIKSNLISIIKAKKLN